MPPSQISHPALHAAKARWAAAQQHHALRGTPSRELGEDQKAKPFGPPKSKGEALE
jgi:hypothetical protein